MPDFDPGDAYSWKDSDGGIHLIPDMDDDYIKNVLHFLVGKDGFREAQVPVLMAEAERRDIQIPKGFPHP